MDPVGFALRCWEKLWDKDGLLPPIESNQGLLILVVLALILAALASQTKRARKAEARALQVERDRRLEAEAAENLRRQHDEASRAREMALLERIERTEQDRKVAQLRQFADAADAILVGVLHQLQADQQQAETDRTVQLPRPTQAAKRQATVAATSLTSILPAAPMNAGLIVATREAALMLEILANTPPVTADQADKITDDFMRLLMGARTTIVSHEKAMLAELGQGRAAAQAGSAAMGVAPPA